jgi:DNA recombination protein RmuC
MQTDMMVLLIVVVASLAAAVFSFVTFLHVRASERRLEQMNTGQHDLASGQASVEDKIDSEMRHTREQVGASIEGLDRRLVDMSGQIGGVKEAMAHLESKTMETLGNTRVAEEKSFSEMQSRLVVSLRGVQDSVSQQLIAIRDDNNKSLEKMRATVDEKLQKTLDERITQSFQLVNDQLDSVSKGLGEMRGMAQNVGDLKKVLSNVKTRGIVGEVQLGAILEEILSPEQYATNIATVPDSSNRVEFAVKITSQGLPQWLPFSMRYRWAFKRWRFKSGLMRFKGCLLLSSLSCQNIA